MIKYETLLTNRCTIAQYRKTSHQFPWAFPKAFLSKKQQYGIAPILAVNVNSQQKFLLAVSITPLQNQYCPNIAIGHTLRQSINASQQWLREFRPIWLSKDSLQFYFAAIQSDSHLPPQQVDGASPGLSCVLAGLSALLQEPLSISWAYSAAIDAQGLLHPVNALEDKVQLMLGTPNLRNLVVHDSQKNALIEYCTYNNIPIRILGAKSIQEVLNIVPIGDHPNITNAIHHQLESLHTPELTEYLEHSFQATLLGQSQIYAWGALHRSLSSLPIKTIQGLSKHTQFQKRFIQLISARYGRCQTEIVLSIEDIQWLNQLKVGQRIPAMAHILQQLINTPTCIEESALPYFWTTIQKELPSDQFTSDQLIAPPYLKLWGAWSRYLSAKHQKMNDFKQLETIFAIQKNIFQNWIENGIFQEASYPLCELIVLSKDHLPHRLDEVLNLWHNFQRLPNAITAQNEPFIQMALSRRTRSSLDRKN